MQESSLLLSARFLPPFQQSPCWLTPVCLSFLPSEVQRAANDQNRADADQVQHRCSAGPAGADCRGTETVHRSVGCVQVPEGWPEAKTPPELVFRPITACSILWAPALKHLPHDPGWGVLRHSTGGFRSPSSDKGTLLTNMKIKSPCPEELKILLSAKFSAPSSQLCLGEGGCCFLRVLHSSLVIKIQS